MGDQTITTAATGRVTAPPDEVGLRFSANAIEPGAADARHAVADQARQLRQHLDDAGVPDEQIRTERFRIRRRRPDRRDRDEPLDEDAQPFIATESVSVTLHDLDLLGGTLSAAVDRAGVEIDGVHFSFQTETHRTLQREATADAVRHARERADAAAAAEDLAVGEVRWIATDGAPRPDRKSGGRQLSTDQLESGSVQSGPIEVRASVEVEYELRER